MSWVILVAVNPRGINSEAHTLGYPMSSALRGGRVARQKGLIRKKEVTQWEEVIRGPEPLRTGKIP